VLETLSVKGRAPKTGYDREGKFGEAWLDTDANSCRTRDDVLTRDLTNVVRDGACEVLSGTLADPYSGKTLAWTKGGDVLVDIDHLVPLHEAWQKGAQQISQEQRVLLANDPLNLAAVDGGLNRQKGDADAATWLPPNKSVRCAYVARQVAVKAKYQLWVTSAEKEAVKGVLASCPDEPAPVDGSRSLMGGGGGAPVAEVPAPSAPASAPEPPSAGGADPQFPSCKAAKAAGFGPYASTDPEYAWYRDADADGSVCE
jgi:hypothetical protein